MALLGGAEMSYWEELMAEDWSVIESMLPDGWEQKAEELGAWERVRGFRSKEVLLRTLLIHIALGCSLKETAVRAQEADFAEVSSVALFKRLKTSGEWLRWLALGVIEKWLVPAGQGLCSMDLSLKLVDATTVQELGAKGTSWRVHYAIGLPSLACEQFEVTSRKEGESLKHFSVTPGDIVLGDRAYAYRGQIAYVVGNGADVVVRTGLTNLPTMDTRDRPFNVLAHLRRLRNGEIGDWNVCFEHEDTVVKGRICAVRKSLASRKQSRGRSLREAGKKGRIIKPETLEAADYVIVFTTLHAGFSADMVMEIYRCRWQVELAFKRLKSLLGLGNLKKFNPEAAKAWLHGKLLVAGLIQALIQAGRSFSPWGYLIRNRRLLPELDVEGDPVDVAILSSSDHSVGWTAMVPAKLEAYLTEAPRATPEAGIAIKQTHKKRLRDGLS
jgi:hypothetical protein